MRLPFALSVAVLAAALAVSRARLHGSQDEPRQLQDARRPCDSDADCGTDLPACNSRGECSWLVDPNACWRDSCNPGDDKLCRRNAHCTGGSSCRRNRHLRYNSCMCPRNQVWRELSARENVCEEDFDEPLGPIMTPGAPVFGCTCPPGMWMETNGWCVPTCCEGQLRARAVTRCPQVCGQTIDCAAETSIWNGGETDGAMCACAGRTPVFDPVRQRCVASQADCDARSDDECAAPLVWHRFMPCPQRCDLAEDQVCAAVAQSGCGCPAGLPYFDPDTRSCVASRAECAGSGAQCAAPLVWHAPMKPCQQYCGEEPQFCIDELQPGCGCPEDAPLMDRASGACVAACPQQCAGGRVFFPVSKPCEQTCGAEEVSCGPLQAGCACPLGQKWSPVSAQCVQATRCDIRL